MSEPLADSASTTAPAGLPLWQRLLPWAITLLCFGYLYSRLSGAAARDGLTLVRRAKRERLHTYVV